MPAFDPSRLRAAREARELSREHLARLTGLTYSAITKFEHALSQPSARTLGRLAGALDCTVADLFNPAEPAPDRDAELHQIVAALPPLDGDARRRLAVLLTRESA